MPRGRRLQEEEAGLVRPVQPAGLEGDCGGKSGCPPGEWWGGLRHHQVKGKFQRQSCRPPFPLSQPLLSLSFLSPNVSSLGSLCSFKWSQLEVEASIKVNFGVDVFSVHTIFMKLY